MRETLAALEAKFIEVVKEGARLGRQLELKQENKTDDKLDYYAAAKIFGVQEALEWAINLIKTEHAKPKIEVVGGMGKVVELKR